MRKEEHSAIEKIEKEAIKAFEDDLEEQTIDFVGSWLGKWDNLEKGESGSEVVEIVKQDGRVISGYFFDIAHPRFTFELKGTYKMSYLRIHYKAPKGQQIMEDGTCFLKLQRDGSFKGYYATFGGCGLFELTRQSRLFISYSHKDSEFVETLEPLLDSKGVRYWRDVHDMRAGRIEAQIDRGIILNPLVLLILSENSVRSDWVEDEATKARELERQYRDQGQPRDVLCPIALDDSWKRSDWPRWLRRQIEDYAILDFSGWRDPDVLKKPFGKLYEGIVLNYRA